MAKDEAIKTVKSKRIVVIKNGPYSVEGDIPLVSKTQVVSEYGEPLTWKKDGAVAVSEGEYHLCRCGQTGNSPFCDGSHRKVGFDGTETADTGSTEMRAVKYPRGTHIIVRKDSSLCMLSGYCGMHDTGMNQLVAATNDTKTRSLVMAMVERCPSGALTYRIEAVDGDAPPVTVTHCMIEAEAQAWIRHRLKDDVRAATDRLIRNRPCGPPRAHDNHSFPFHGRDVLDRVECSRSIRIGPREAPPVPCHRVDSPDGTGERIHRIEVLSDLHFVRVRHAESADQRDHVREEPPQVRHGKPAVD